MLMVDHQSSHSLVGICARSLIGIKSLENGMMEATMQVSPTRDAVPEVQLVSISLIKKAPQEEGPISSFARKLS